MRCPTSAAKSDLSILTACPLSEVKSGLVIFDVAEQQSYLTSNEKLAQYEL